VALVALVIPGRGASERHLEGDKDGRAKIFRGEPERATPLPVDQDLAITMVEPPRWETFRVRKLR